MKNIQNRCDLSNNAILDVASSLRADGVDLEPGLRNDLYESGTLLEEFFEVKNLDMEVKVENDLVVQSKPVVVCKSVPEFVEFIKKKRNTKNSILAKYGADGGGKSYFS